MTSLVSPSENPCFFGCFEGVQHPGELASPSEDPEDLQQARIQGKLSWLRAVSRQITYRPPWRDATTRWRLWAEAHLELAFLDQEVKEADWRGLSSSPPARISGTSSAE